MIDLDEVATAIKFGRFGREEGALVLATRTGGLQVKLFRRTAKFEEKSNMPGPPAAQAQKLNIPKKTKVFVDQTMRERERDDAKRMHQVCLFCCVHNTVQFCMFGVFRYFNVTCS